MNVYIMALEAIESRYTWYWETELEKRINEYIKNDITLNEKNIKVITLKGDDEDNEVVATQGAFLNFTTTNAWKNSQMNKLIGLFKSGEIKPKDKIIFPDAWHPGIIQVRYISELTKVPVSIYSLWHAGSYDYQDFLGREIQDKSWVRHAEAAFFDASDYNLFATRFHKSMFMQTFKYRVNKNKAHIVGFPFQYIKDVKQPEVIKENIILFPHRISSEKQPQVFKELAKRIPEYQFIICQEKNLSKTQYGNLLARSKMVFSANLQETLGISCYEGAVNGALPFVPDRLSYKEMYPKWCQYEGYLTGGSLESRYLDILSFMVKDMLANYDEHAKKLPSLVKRLDRFFTMDKMLQVIF